MFCGNHLNPTIISRVSRVTFLVPRPRRLRETGGSGNENRFASDTWVYELTDHDATDEQ